MSGSCEGSQFARILYESPRDGKGAYISYKPPVEIINRPGGMNDFNGGQCQCVLYDFSIQIQYNAYFPNFSYSIGWFQDFITQEATGSASLYGPISTNILTVSEGRRQWQVEGYQSNCETVQIVPCLIAGNPNTTKGGQSFRQDCAPISFKLLNMRRRDGQPDNCGDPPQDCELEIHDSTGKLATLKGIGSRCPTAFVQCEGDCPQGQHKDKSGKCCCNNNDELKKLVNDIKKQVGAMK